MYGKSCQIFQFLRYQIHRSHRLINHFVIQILRFINYTGVLIFSAYNRGNNLHHERDQRQPYQCTDHVECRMCIGNLAGDHIDLISFWRDITYKLCKPRNDPDKYAGTRDIEKAVCNCGTFCIFGLSDGCQKCCDRRTDIIAKQNRNRSCQSDHAADTVRSCLGSKALKNCDRCRGTLYHQSHHRTEDNTQYRNRRYFSHQIYKDRASCQWFHNAAHDLDSFKQKSERKDNHTNIFKFFFFP